jgi:hypothetical protein
MIVGKKLKPFYLPYRIPENIDLCILMKENVMKARTHKWMAT